MSTKIQGKIPNIINKNKNLKALVSKLNSDDIGTNVRKVQPTNLPTISDSIKDKILNNETIVKLFPDIELSIQIMTSSILAPNDMGSTNLIYSSNDKSIPSEVKIGLLEEIKEYISSNYKIEEKLPDILRESMFTKGAYIEAIIPESSIDAMINQDSLNGSLESLVDDNVKEGNRINLLGRNTAVSCSFEDMELSEKMTGEATIADEELLLDITDNYGVLGAVSKAVDHVSNIISNEMYKEGIEKKELDMFDKLFKPTPVNKDSSVVTVLTNNETPNETVGKPLVIKLPVVSTIPVHVSGDVTKHLGYFVMLDEKGVPITADDTWDMNGDSLNSEMGKKAKSIIDKASNAINGFTKKDPTMKDMEELYSHIITAKIKKKLSDGILGDLATIDEDNSDVYKVMLTRVLSKQKTRLLFIPSELVSYYAFKYRDNGTGESMLETITVLSSIRAILLFARIMANVKNSVTTTEVSATLDDNDIDPSKTMDKIISEVMKNRQTQLPIGVTRVEDIVDWTKKVGYKFNFKHKDLPDMDIDVSENNSSKVVPDSDLDEEIRKQILMTFSLPPKAVEDGYDSDFATTIVQSNVLFTKRVNTYQDKLMPMISGHINKLIKNDGIIYGIIYDTIEANYNKIIAYLKKNKSLDTDLKKVNKENLTKWLTNKYIDNIVISLPRIEEHNDDNMKEAFENYKDAIEDYIESFFGDESMPEELAGELGDKTETFRDAMRHTLLRKWMSDNNYMPELLKATSMDSEGNVSLDVYSEYINYLETMGKVILPFMKTINKKKTKLDKKIEKMDEEEEPEDAEDEGTDTGDGETSDDNEEPQDGEEGDEESSDDNESEKALDDFKI